MLRQKTKTKKKNLCTCILKGIKAVFLLARFNQTASVLVYNPGDNIKEKIFWEFMNPPMEKDPFCMCVLTN